MTDSKDETWKSMTGDNDPLSPAIEKSLRRLYTDVDTRINDVDTRVKSRLERRLVAEGLLADKNPSDEKNASLAVRFWRNLGGWRLSFNTPIVAIASLVVVAFGVLFYQQREKTLQVESELKAAKSLLERQEGDSAVYAKSDSIINAKLYTDQADILIKQVRDLAAPLGMKVEVVMEASSNDASTSVPVLREGQRLIAVGPFVSTDPKQRELKELLELPEDTEGSVNVVLIEF
ncbi:MAG: hypothetical protein FJ184_04480 [Gammaproteobacteria bacterium]|nr:hypothetical protein [Gammaproteobacteria bacterium]